MAVNFCHCFSENSQHNQAMYRSSPLFKFASMESGAKDYLFAFKAGKMVLNGKLVSPIKEKRGLIFIQNQDEILHFCWMNRYTDEIEDDLIILPGDAEFIELPQCKTGRAFVLKFRNSTKRLFFWSQEPIAEGDKNKVDFATKINDLIMNQENRLTSQTRVKNSLRELLSSEQGTQKLANLFGNSNKSNPLMRLLSLYSSNMEKMGKKQNSGKDISARNSLTSKSNVELTKSNTRDILNDVQSYQPQIHGEFLLL